MAKENPHNNDAIQMLLDIRRAAAEAGKTEIAVQAGELYNESMKGKNNKITQMAQKIYRAHKYKNIRYAMQMVYGDDSSVICTLSTAARLVWLAYTMCATNQCVQLTRKQLSDLTGIKDLHTITNAVKELTELGLLIVQKKRTNKTAAIYRLNTTLIQVGKARRLEKDVPILKKHDTKYKLVSLGIDEGETAYSYTMLVEDNDNYIADSE